MDRPRNISLALLKCPELRDVSAEAEIFGQRLSVACDDFGRARIDYDVFRKKLFPRHPEARDVIEYWCREIEKSGFIERYRVGASDCLWIRRWAEYQDIKDPRPSDLPRAPGEKVAPPAPTVEAPAVKRADATLPPPGNELPPLADTADVPVSIAEVSDESLDDALAQLLDPAARRK